MVMWYIVIWLGTSVVCVDDDVADMLCEHEAAQHGLCLDETPELPDGTRYCVMH